jgi:hypothetical protein
MKIPMSLSLRVCVSAAIALGAGSAVPAPVSSTAQTEQSAQSAMIVIMRDQMSDLSAARGASSSRGSALALSQNSAVSHLQRVRARQVKSFSSINAFATTMTSAEREELLASHPEVLNVVPDRVIHALPRKETKTATAAAATATSTTSDLCGTLEPEALQLTNTAFSNLNTAQAQLVLDGNGQPVTGKGVKVAFLADGMDPNVAGFIRPDGSHVFFDYQDFTGDPAGTPTAGGEAFGDAASIAAQDMPKGKVLNFDISKFVAASHPLPSPCNIHIRGMAPGASLMGLKVFSAGVTTTSNFVQAIEYAVAHDIDVINESFGGNPYFDSEGDPITLANSAAVKAGVTVTVSTGDGGDNGTLGSPSTGPGIIAVGATTSFRLYAQTGQGVIPLLPGKGFVSNNISPFSSGGFAQLTPRTVDVVAPGQDGWALCSSNVTLFQDCVDYNNNPTDIEDFGGTSEAAPLTAGEAALVIQAYRSSHGGKDPSPALVKQIIMSSATDLGAPTSEQGAGLINSLAAVHTALSINDGNGKPKPHSNSLLSSVSSVVITAEGNTHETETFKITNTGWGARKIVPSVQKLGAPVAGATVNFQLDPATLPSFANVTGAARAYTKQKITVPGGLDHLDVAISYLVSLTSSDTPIVYLSLVDPAGRQVQYSVPQGLSVGYGHVDVVKPVAGVYTAYVYTRASGVGAYTGPIQLTWAGERFVTMGTVSPASVTIAPGATQSFTASFFTPSEPGDLAAGIRFEATDGLPDMPEIPVTIRTLVPVGPTGGSFSGVLTGGNGRAATGNSQTYEFDVPPGVKDMSLVVPVADNGYLLQGFLVDPQGMQLSVAADVDPFGAAQYGLQHFRTYPQAGRWHYVLVQTFTSSGNQTSLPFTARIAFNKSQVSAPDLPNSEGIKLSASGKPVKVTIDVVNTGLLSAAYFADARLRASTYFALSQQPDCAAVATLPGTCAEFILPTEVSKVQFTAKSTVPIQMDAYNFVGFTLGTDNPDIFAEKTAPNTVVATLSEPELPYGAWYVNPSEIGPYPAAGAPTKPVTMTAAVIMKAFDTTVSADSGDAWADLTYGTNTFNPPVIAPGEDAPIVLTITPDPSKVGQVVSGYIYIDTYNPNYGTGDEVVRLPYTYTVAP